MSDHDGHDSGGHAVPIKILVITCLSLLFLTAVTVWVASLDFDKLQLPGINIFIALLVASFKVLIVGLIFMHLRWDRSFTGLVFVSSIFFVVLFLSIAITDTKEYQPLVIQTDSEKIQQQLDQLDHSLDGYAGHGHEHGEGEDGH
ncbi:MAG TPA: hypothetical protein DEO57_02805 [Phycisphaerales bacterium]|nr:hypothetical protein [Phycisphaerales bacterium]|tara:strand:+ start:264 stop:698 length:435 start_codon:yes stop_codon:yes gene_type:complete